MWAGSATSALGDAVVQIALIFAILRIGGTASDIGLVLALTTVARVAFLLAGGVWADRLGRQYVMLAADGVRGVVQAGLAALLLTGHAHLWELAAGGALYGAAASFFDPASTALVPETVPAEQLQRANSLLGLPGSVFSVAGPAAAGVLIAAFGPGWLFAADAASFFVSLACLARLRVPPRPVPAPRPFLADLAEGWHELAIRPWYWINLLAHACGNFVVPALFVLGPVIAARSLGGAPAWGALSAAWGAGAVAGGIVGLRVKPRRPLVAADLLMAGIALPLLALALSRSVAHGHAGTDPGPGPCAGRRLRLVRIAGHHAGRLAGDGSAVCVDWLHPDAGRGGGPRVGSVRRRRAGATRPGRASDAGRSGPR
jgi:MFS family permease